VNPSLSSLNTSCPFGAQINCLPIVQSVDNTGLLSLFFPIKLAPINESLYLNAS
jgi:hypothetical protein